MKAVKEIDLTLEYMLCDYSPRNYVVEVPDHLRGQPLTFFAWGCSGNEPQTVATFMSTVAKQLNPLWACSLGDHWYSGVMKSPTDPAFKRIIETYKVLGVPILRILGNHEGGFDKEHQIKESVSNGVKSIGNVGVTILNAVVGSDVQKYSTERVFPIPHNICATYINSRGIFNPETVQLFKGCNSSDLKIKPAGPIPLKLNQLVDWNCFSRFYTVKIGNLHQFMMDSNCFATDMAEYLRLGREACPWHNQIKFFLEAYQGSDAPVKILEWHHPVVDTKGKRHNAHDTKLYRLESADVSILRERGLYDDNYNTLLGNCLKTLGLRFSLVITAHDHANYLCTNEQGDIQAVFGGGGAEAQLQSYRNFARRPNLKFFSRQQGFGSVTVYPDNDLTIGFHLVNGEKSIVGVPHNNSSSHAYFSTRGECLFFQDQRAQQQNIVNLREAVFTSANEFFEYLRLHPNYFRLELTQDFCVDNVCDLVAQFQKSMLTADSVDQIFGKYVDLIKRILPHTDPKFIEILSAKVNFYCSRSGRHDGFAELFPDVHRSAFAKK